MVVLPTFTVLMGTSMKVPPAGIVAVEGTVTTVVSKLCNCTTWPVGPAAKGAVTRMVPSTAVFKFKGLGVRLKRRELTAVMVTVAGTLFATPSFTINCMIYVPAKSGMNVG